MSLPTTDTEMTVLVQQSQVAVPWCDEFEKMINGEQCVFLIWKAFNQLRL